MSKLSEKYEFRQNALSAFDALYNGRGVICGVDEAGKGPLAWSVTAAAVIMPAGCRIPGVDDSKKVSEKRRESLFEEIKKSAVAVSVGEATAAEIDGFNIDNATKLAMARALSGLSVTPGIVLIDGNRPPDINLPYVMITDGDAKSFSIACASIIAKVHRDAQLKKLDEQYPQYGFAKHKGYGTKQHFDALREFGMIDGVHRKSFLKKFFEGGNCAGGDNP